jgi:hypothetical protein
MPLCGARFDENSVPPWTRGDFRGVFERVSLPLTRKAILISKGETHES